MDDSKEKKPTGLKQTTGTKPSSAGVPKKPTTPTTSTTPRTPRKPTASSGTTPGAAKPGVSTPKPSAPKPSTAKPTGVSGAKAMPRKPSTGVKKEENPVEGTVDEKKEGAKKSEAKPKVKAKEAGKKPKVDKIETDELDVVKVESESEEDKKKKRKIILIILLIFLFASAIGVGIYFISQMQTIIVDFEVTVKTLDVNDTYYDEQHIEQKIKYVPGDNVDLDLIIGLRNKLRTTPVEAEGVYVRIKVNLETNETSYDNIFTPIFDDETMWIAGDDGYYYYTEKHIGDGDLKALKALYFNTETENGFLNGGSGNIVFTIESVQADYKAVDSYWVGAPRAWKALI